MAVVCQRRLRGSGRHAPRARPEGGRTRKFAVLNTVLILKLERRAPRKSLKTLARPERFELPTPRFVVCCSGGLVEPLPTISSDP
jgi:hypothetical protein